MFAFGPLYVFHHPLIFLGIFFGIVLPDGIHDCGSRVAAAELGGLVPGAPLGDPLASLASAAP